MITLYTFGPSFGLPDGSPFVTKAMLLLKFAGLPYRENRQGLSQAPKGKLPYIDDAGITVADSTFIRFTSRKNTGSISMPGSPPSRKRRRGRSKKCAKSTFIWPCWRRAGSMTRILPEGPAQFFKALPLPLRPIVPRPRSPQS